MLGLSLISEGADNVLESFVAVVTPQTLSEKVVPLHLVAPTKLGDENVYRIEVNGVQYGLQLTGDLEEYSDLTLYHINEDGTLGVEALSMTNSSGYCTITICSNLEVEDAPSLSFVDLNSLVDILTKV